MTGRPRVYIAYTGGTVGMARTAHGFRPRPGHLQELMARIPQFHQEPVPEFEICQYDPLLDSSDMTPADWMRIASDLLARRDGYDGFLVVHGTDTMAYTASALSFMLLGFGKPVLLTGSQIPLEETRNDAQENLLTALIILGQHHRALREVCVYFDNTLLRGNRATKVDAESFHAFTSPNQPPLGTVGVDIEIGGHSPTFGVALDPAQTLGGAGPEPRLYPIGGARVTSFSLFPGVQASQVEAMVAPPVQGAVMACFGAGNAPSDAELLGVLRAATDAGVVVVAITQPLVGSANLGRYATGRALAEAGVVGGYDLTAEAALTKLLYLLGLGLSPADVRRWMQVPLAGELTRLDPAERTVRDLFPAAIATPLEPRRVCNS